MKQRFYLGQEQAIVRIAAEMIYGVDVTFTPVQILCKNLDRESESSWWDTFANADNGILGRWDAVKWLLHPTISDICLQAIRDAVEQTSSIPSWHVLGSAMPDVSAALARVQLVARTKRNTAVSTHVRRKKDAKEKLQKAIVDMLERTTPIEYGADHIYEAEASANAARAYLGEVKIFNVFKEMRARNQKRSD